MTFINRNSELTLFRNDYENNTRINKSQVYIIEAGHGIGKSEFIREASRYFSHHPVEIFQSDENDELSTFKDLVIELDKCFSAYDYDDFKTFYRRKAFNSKAIQLILKITAIFGQALAKFKDLDVNLDTLIDDPDDYEEFILNAQTENLYEYAAYVFSIGGIPIVFHQASRIDLSSLNLLSKLITTYENNVFIFESNGDECSQRIKHSLHNNHNTFLAKYRLSKLSDEHIQKYIQELLRELRFQAERVDSQILKKVIEKGDLSEIASILNDYNDRVKKDTSAKIRNVKEIIVSLPEPKIALLILANYTEGKLNLSELEIIINELNIPFDGSYVDDLVSKNLIESGNGHITVMPFADQIISSDEFMISLKYAVASALIRNLNASLVKCFNAKYVDILVAYYLNTSDYHQLKTMLPIIGRRLKCFNTQAERIDYFQRFVLVLQKLYDADPDSVIEYAKTAYEANLYLEALSFIKLAEDREDTIYLKALILNRSEYFQQSREYIEINLNKTTSPSISFQLKMVLMMDLIQLGERKHACEIFEGLKTCVDEPLYPFLIRLSNVFCKNYNDRLKVVQSISEAFYQSEDNEFCGLHAVYLAYLYALTGHFEQAENSLTEARRFWGNNLIYNHMILHNEATIKFMKNDIDEEIPALLHSAQITAYDEYDRFAINNNLLCYYILCDKISSLECQRIVMELEDMLGKTGFKRFVDKIHYNLCFYYKKMYNTAKYEYYMAELAKNGKEPYGEYHEKLMYETSWKLPITFNA